MTGILLIDKPTGWTSSDVVAKLRGVLHEKRIGHSGTLDPMATGLLVLFVGRATRAVQFAEAQDKRYLASLRLGLTTDTQDVTGTVLAERDASAVTEARLRAALVGFLGAQQQLPPMYSAVKVGGRKLYEIARRGGQVERKPRPITITRLDLLGREGEDWLLDVGCSKGAYVRTLCHDLGESLGCGGCLSALRRTEAGAFWVEAAHSIDEVIAAAAEGRAETLLLPLDSLFAAYPAHTAPAALERAVRCGNPGALDAPEGECRLYGADGAFLALGRVAQGIFTTIKSFFEV